MILFVCPCCWEKSTGNSPRKDGKEGIYFVSTSLNKPLSDTAFHGYLYLFREGWPLNSESLVLHHS